MTSSSANGRSHDRTVVTAAVLNYEAGNVRSAQRALLRAGAQAFITGDGDEAAAADLLVVPGVGHFGQCVRHFREAGFEDLVRRRLAEGRPLLGICVGMQILYAGSDEDPGAEGLAMLPGHVRRLPGDVVVPHMGWDVVRVVRDDPAVAGLDGRRCYFTHSYYADPADDAHVVAVCDYGPGFPCVVRTGPALGLQFHPEKSSDVGARMLHDLVAAVADGRAGAEVTSVRASRRVGGGHTS
ncbi:MAG TPA: imidazole glycerol phosphate synthase subunit HisH [Euzebyales bacterium]|nr:imidazole glycerol phosphate synthase subunit HisH [Euzebyales bacterium]